MNLGRSQILRLLSGLLAVALTAAVVAGCGSDDDDGPSSEDVPAGAVASVGDVQVSKQDLAAQVAVLKRMQRGNDAGGMGKAAMRSQLETQALASLLTREAIEQEAADRGIEVSPAEVRKSFLASSSRQFKNKRELKRFLGGQSVQELVAQLRLQQLSQRISDQVSEKAGGGKKGAKAAKEFQQEFQKRWQDRTACAEGYTAPGCATD